MMKAFSVEEIMLFTTIMKVYESNPSLALSCISDKNIERFEQFVSIHIGDKSKFIIQEIRELNKVNRSNRVEMEKVKKR